jgi:DNA-binding HxlR family transcriptional regulator
MPSRAGHPRQVVAAGRESHQDMLRTILGRIGDKWSVIVICRLCGSPRRFNELRRMTEGITQRMLSSTLRHLERDGLVTRTVHATVPPQVEYALTESGQSLHEVLYLLVEWTEEHVGVIQRAQSHYDACARGAAQAGSHGTPPAR